MQPYQVAPAATPVVLLNLDQATIQNLAMQQQTNLQDLSFGSFLNSIGDGMKQVSKAAPEIYKGAKAATYAVGDTWKQLDPKSYEKYGAPVGNTMYDTVQAGKSMGGWKAFGQYGDMAQQYGHMMDSNLPPMQPQAQAQPQAQPQFQAQPQYAMLLL